MPNGKTGYRVTDMETRGPLNVNMADAAASQPRYNLRSTDNVNKGESSVTRVDPHHCAILPTAADETEHRHSTLTYV